MILVVAAIRRIPGDLGTGIGAVDDAIAVAVPNVLILTVASTGTGNAPLGIFATKFVAIRVDYED